MKKNVLKYILALPAIGLLWLLNIYTEELYRFLTGDYLQSLEKLVSYKLLFQICLLLLLSLFALTIYLFRLIKKIGSGDKNEPTVFEKHRIAQEVLDAMNKKKLENLSRTEKITLREFTVRETKSYVLSIFDASARGLVNEGILKILGDYPDYKAMYKVEEWAWKAIKENPKYLE